MNRIPTLFSNPFVALPLGERLKPKRDFYWRLEQRRLRLRFFNEFGGVEWLPQTDKESCLTTQNSLASAGNQEQKGSTQNTP